MTIDTLQLKGDTINIVKVMERRQVVIPKKIFERLGLRIGDYLEAKFEKNRIVYIPKKIIDRDNWYFSKEGQESIKKSFKDKKEGRVIGPFNNVQKALKALKEYESRDD